MNTESGRGFKPTVSEEYAAKLRQWQDNIFEWSKTRETQQVQFLGRTFTIPPDVHPINPMSDLLGNAVLQEVQETDRVLDMGTGCGVNAVLAASKSSDVVAVDINPFAVASAIKNAEDNGVSARIAFHESDVFESVKGQFDLIIFDPPFRWFKPRDIRETSTTDENYRALTKFFREVRDYLRPDGRILVCFGSSGDIGYLEQLTSEAGFNKETLATRNSTKEGIGVSYLTFRFTMGRRNE